MFRLEKPYKPAWDQPKAIREILENFESWNCHLTLLWATWTWKTFTMANIIEQMNLPTLVLSHNKTLAAQLTTEFKWFFPENAVNYFVSYFDYYQPESYLPEKDMYIEKDSAINNEIEMYRLAAMSNLLSRKDSIIISSVSAIYWLWTAELFVNSSIKLKVWEEYKFEELKKNLLDIQYDPIKWDITAWTFNFSWSMLDIYSSIEEIIYRMHFDENKIVYIEKKNPQTWKKMWNTKEATIWPATQFMQNMNDLDKILKDIEKEKNKRVKYFEEKWELLFAQRINQKVSYDIKMIKETWFTAWVENYSRFFDDRSSWEPPQSLFDYFPEEFLLIIDESHMTIPQFQWMPSADRSRKTNLINYWFRLPSAIDHRPLFWEEIEFLTWMKEKKDLPKLVWIDYIQKSWRKKKKVYVLFVSATPADYEKNLSKNRIVEQIIRPTWLLDPITYIYPKSWDYEIFNKDLGKFQEKLNLKDN